MSSSIRSIGFFGPLMGVGTNCGYGYSAVELIKAWQRKNVEVWYGDKEAPVAFSYGQPHFYERVEGALNIGYTFWESDGVPEQWVHHMNQMDEIWGGCKANLDWYRAAGVTKPMKLLPLGVNEDHYPLLKRSISPGEPFRFLHIGEPTKRKGGELAYHAFCEAFDVKDNVRLVMKGKPRFKVDHPNVEVIREYLSVEDLRKLYLEHHAMIYPTNGEGFGLIPFQAAATGMPTAVTAWSAPTDYMEYCFPISVDELVVADYEPHEGLWAAPSFESVVMWLQSFYDSPNYFFSKAFRNGQRLHEAWSWDSVSTLALEYMSDSLTRLPN